MRHLYVLSSDEAQLPSSALRLSSASPSRLALSIDARTLTSSYAVCVRVTVAASADGMLYGSRVLAMWLTTGEGVGAAPPLSCVGDGVAYVPAHWEDLANVVNGGDPSGQRDGVPISLVATLLVAIVFGVPFALRWRAERAKRGGAKMLLASGVPSSSEYPDPTDSPGSQQGCFPLTSAAELDAAACAGNDISEDATLTAGAEAASTEMHLISSSTRERSRWLPR